MKERRLSGALGKLLVVNDPPHITVTIPSLSHASSTSSAAITVSSVLVPPAQPEEGFHVETLYSAPPAPAAMLTTPLEFHHAPIDLVITAAAMGAIVAWHIRRTRLNVRLGLGFFLV